MSVTLGDESPPYSTLNNWVAGFRKGHLSVEDEELSGSPTQVTIRENMDNIYTVILYDRKIYAKGIA
jgi:hypothetical protein